MRQAVNLAEDCADASKERKERAQRQMRGLVVDSFAPFRRPGIEVYKRSLSALRRQEPANETVVIAVRDLQEQIRTNYC